MEATGRGRRAGTIVRRCGRVGIRDLMRAGRAAGRLRGAIELLTRCRDPERIDEETRDEEVDRLRSTRFGVLTERAGRFDTLVEREGRLAGLGARLTDERAGVEVRLDTGRDRLDVTRLGREVVRAGRETVRVGRDAGRLLLRVGREVDRTVRLAPFGMMSSPCHTLTLIRLGILQCH